MGIVELTESRIEALQGEHGEGKMAAIEGPGPEGMRQWFVLRRPNKPEWLKFQRDQKDDNKAAAAQNELVCKLCVFPGPDEMRQTCNEFPGFVLRAGQEVLELAGFVDGAEVKKL